MSNLKPVRGILLDIEGTTSSISYVHEVLFPFALRHLEGFVGQHWHRLDVQQAGEQIARDAGFDSLNQWASQISRDPARLVIDQVRELMARDVKATGLKALQGLIWQAGYDSGELRSQVFPDVLPAIEQWIDQGLQVRIYSSGSVAAQKLFFGHVDGAGDCLHLFGGHYDTTIGSKQQPDSYLRIAEHWQLPADEILFISDLAGELLAARSAGLQVRASVRPGNAPLPVDFPAATIRSFAEIRTPQFS